MKAYITPILCRLCRNTPPPTLTTLLAWLILSVLSTGATAQAQPITLDYWHAYSGTIGEEHNRLVHEFEALHPDIDVRVTYGGNLWTMRDKLNTALMSGNAPDLASIDQFWVAELAENGFTVPLERLESLGVDFHLGGLLPMALEVGRYKGVLHALPFAMSSTMLFVNLDLLHQLGLSHSDIPQHWSELIELSERLAEQRSTSNPWWILGAPTTASTGVVYPFIVTLWQFGGEIFDRSGTHVSFDDPAGIEALLLWQTLVGADILDTATPSGVWEAGKLLFQVASSAHLIATYRDLPFNVDVAPLPYATQRVTGSGGRSLAVFGDNQERLQAAAIFAAWMTSPEVNGRWSERTGYAPLRHENLAALDYQERLERDPRLATITDELLYSRLRPNHLSYTEVSRILGEAIEYALYHGGDPAPILRSAAEDADTAIQRRVGSDR